jgi:copper chaperone CopZ
VTKENLTVADYAIEGMVCAMGCAGTIEKDVAALTGVLASKVDYEAGKGHFEFDKAVITEKEIIAKIESIANGQYSVDKWEEEKAIGNQIESDTDDEVEEEKITLNNVSLPSFKVPNLFTLLLDQI